MLRTKLPLLIACCALLPEGRLHAQQEGLEGVFLIDESASDDIGEAIAHGTASMNFAIRSLARSRTAKTNPRYERVEIHRGDKTVNVKYDSRAPLNVPTDGRSVPWVREDGATYQVSAEWSPPNLKMLFESDTGNRTNTLVLQPDGRTLKFTVTLTSSYLPAPILYTLIYRR